uniref:Transmembrane protein n=1 Tax=Tanacetum cinerariifolium TaxID=118510 RepID=A0A699V0H1_TANCI|nr:hypothetical protein [Tanacetum cinerariifolium]
MVESSRSGGNSGVAGWRENLAVNSGCLNVGGKKGVVWSIYTVGPCGFQGLTVLVLAGLNVLKYGRNSP